MARVFPNKEPTKLVKSLLGSCKSNSLVNKKQAPMIAVDFREKILVNEPLILQKRLL